MKAGKLAFELGGKAAGGEPCVERSFDQKFDLGAVKNFSRHRYVALAGDKRLRSQCDVMVLLYELADLSRSCVAVLLIFELISYLRCNCAWTNDRLN